MNRGRRCVHARCFENAKSYREHTSVPCSRSVHGEITQRSRFFSAYGDEFRYGFHAALDMKLVSVVGAIDAGDPLLYQPFYWEVDGV